MATAATETIPRIMLQPPRRIARGWIGCGSSTARHRRCRMSLLPTLFLAAGRGTLLHFADGGSVVPPTALPLPATQTYSGIPVVCRGNAGAGRGTDDAGDRRWHGTSPVEAVAVGIAALPRKASLSRDVAFLVAGRDTLQRLWEVATVSCWRWCNDNGMNCSRVDELRLKCNVESCRSSWDLVFCGSGGPMFCARKMAERKMERRVFQSSNRTGALVALEHDTVQNMSRSCQEFNRG